MTVDTDTPAESETAQILVVDDEIDIAELYATWLRTAHDVSVAYTGDDALEAVDETVDVVFLDRQMPGTSGDEVLDVLADRGIDCRVVMVTAVDPDFDIVEMPFDDYLTKPVTREDLVGKVDEMLTRDSYDQQLQEYYSLASKKAALETEKTPADLETNGDYRELCRRLDTLRSKTEETAAEFEDFEAVFSELTRT